MILVSSVEFSNLCMFCSLIQSLKLEWAKIKLGCSSYGIYVHELEYGNAFLTPESIAPGVTEKKMIGSVMIFEAASIEEVRKLIENDVYYKNGVVSVYVVFTLVLSS